MKWSSHPSLVIVVCLLALAGCGKTTEREASDTVEGIRIADIGEHVISRSEPATASSPILAVSIPQIAGRLGPLDGFDVDVDADPPRSFFVLLSNTSRSDVRLWFADPIRSAVEFEIIGPDGQTRSLKRHVNASPRVKSWSSYHDDDGLVFVIRSNESVLWPINLNSSDWQGLSWIEPGKTVRGKLRAIYASSGNSRILTGRVESKWYDVSISHAPKTKRP